MKHFYIILYLLENKHYSQNKVIFDNISVQIATSKYFIFISTNSTN